MEPSQLPQEQAINESEFSKLFLACIRAEAPPLIYGQDPQSLSGQKVMYYNPFTQEYFDVENLALRYYYLHEGLNGMHCENSFGSTVFGLLLWEVIFDSTVPYVF